MFPQGCLIALSISRAKLFEKISSSHIHTHGFFDWAKIRRPTRVCGVVFFKEMLNEAGLTLILCDLQLKRTRIMICLSIG